MDDRVREFVEVALKDTRIDPKDIVFGGDIAAGITETYLWDIYADNFHWWLQDNYMECLGCGLFFEHYSDCDTRPDFGDLMLCNDCYQQLCGLFACTPGIDLHPGQMTVDDFEKEDDQV